MNHMDNEKRTESVEGVLKTLNELFHQANGKETAIGYLENIKTFFKEQRIPNETEIKLNVGIINLVQDLLKERE